MSALVYNVPVECVLPWFHFENFKKIFREPIKSRLLEICITDLVTSLQKLDYGGRFVLLIPPDWESNMRRQMAVQVPLYESCMMIKDNERAKAWLRTVRI